MRVLTNIKVRLYPYWLDTSLTSQWFHLQRCNRVTVPNLPINISFIVSRLQLDSSGSKMAPISLSHIRQTNDTLLNNQPLVAVFVGATSGIGEYSVRALAATHGTTGAGLRLYLVGRNAVAAEKVFADCRRLCPAGKFVFVQADDLALLKNIDVVASEIIKLENEEAGKTGEASRIDFLVMCQGIAKFDGRDGK